MNKNLCLNHAQNQLEGDESCAVVIGKVDYAEINNVAVRKRNLVAYSFLSGLPEAPEEVFTLIPVTAMDSAFLPFRYSLI